MCDGHDSSPALITDLAVRGVWVPQAEALFDERVTDMDAVSYISRSVAAILTSAEDEEKKCMNLLATELHLTF